MFEKDGVGSGYIANASVGEAADFFDVCQFPSFCFWPFDEVPVLQGCAGYGVNDCMCLVADWGCERA